MTDPNFSAIRARLRYESLDEFIDGYSRFISAGGMFIPMAPSKLKPVGTTIRFQFLLQDGSTAMLGEGIVRQIQGADSGGHSPLGMLVKFTKLSRNTKEVVDLALARKDGASEAAPPEQDAEPHEASAPAAADEQETSEQSAPSETLDAPIPAADDASTRDVDTPTTREVDPGEPDESHDDLFLPADADEAITEESEPDELPEEAQKPSDDDIFREVERAAAQEPAADEPLEEKKPAQEDKAAAQAGSHRELGRTEAGLQIMAFDEASEDEMGGFEGFDFGGDEDEVDQMFDGIFGGGSEGGGGLVGSGDEVEEDSVEAEDAPVADPLGDEIDALFDGGQKLNELSKELPADAEPWSDGDAEEAFDLDEEVSLEEASSETFLALDAEDDESEAIELDSEEFELASEEIELESDEFELADKELEDDSEAIELESEEFELASEELELDEPAPSAYEQEEPLIRGLSEESSAPSEELLSALSSLDEGGEDHEIDLSLDVVDSEPEEVAEEAPQDDDEEDQSLAALLAEAQRDIDATREVEEDDERSDILDELLGGDDDLPPPPSNDPVFDIADKESKKKKKGGFISKLFGKD